MTKPVFELPVVKVKATVIKKVREMIKDGFYKNKDKKLEVLKQLSCYIANEYEVSVPDLMLDFNDNNHYCGGEIVIESLSIISFLHEFRHHLQYQAGVGYHGLTIEQDARAWSMRIYSKAVPKMFEKAVKDGKVIHISWSEEENKIIDSASYI